MSRTYAIACTQCKKQLWIGQTHLGSETDGFLYLDEPPTIRALERFLWAHVGHPLVYTNDVGLDGFDQIEV